MSSFLDKAIPVLWLLTMAFAALAHGAVETWSLAIVSISFVVLLLLWALKAVIDGQVTLHWPPTAWPLLALVLFGVAQSISWTDANGQRNSLSLDVEATREATLQLGLWFLAFLIAVNFFVKRARLSALSKFLIYYGMALALFGLVQHATWDGRFYWVRYIGEEITSPFGPFVHHGHYAGYIEMLLPLPIALLVMRCVSSDQRFLYGIAATVMGLSIIVSLARGGMVSLVVEMLFLTWMGFQLMREQDGYVSVPQTPLRLVLSRLGAVVVIVGAISLSVIWMGAEPVINRVLGQVNDDKSTTETLYYSRGWIWRDAWAMFKAHPVTGVGLGAFGTAYPTFTQSDNSIKVTEAHNDYLQTLSDGGIIGAGLLAWFIFVVFRQMFQAMRSPDQFRAALALGAGTGIVGMMVHSFFDFNLQLPAQALMFMLLLAIVAQSAAPLHTRSSS